MSIRSFFKNWIIPPGYLNLSHSKTKSLDKTAFSRELFQSNEQFYNLHKGERCFILASGPSIKTQDLSPIFGETCIAVSHFHLHKDIKNLSPKYHVLAPQHPPFNFNDSSKYFRDFKNQYVDINPHIFLGITDYQYNYLNLLQTHPELKVPNLHYLDYSNYVGLEEDNFRQEELWDISGFPFTQRTVLYGAIQVAVYLGFSEIYLLGADHDYLKDTTRTTNHHFYEEEKGISDKSHLEQFSSERWFQEYYIRWKQYRLIREYCKTKGIKIFNATEGGMLDVFERKSLAHL